MNNLPVAQQNEPSVRQVEAFKTAFYNCHENNVAYDEAVRQALKAAMQPEQQGETKDAPLRPNDSNTSAGQEKEMEWNEAFGIVPAPATLSDEQKQPLSTALWCDVKTDKDKFKWLLLGRGVETGVVARSIQNDLAMAYLRLSSISAYKDELLNLPLEELLGQYWEIAYREGKTGESCGTEAQKILSSIRALTRKEL